MNKKNKGFTLIEVLATIAIIAVVTLIATVTYKKVRQNIINRQYKNLKAVIEIAGVRYTSKTGKTAYFVRELIEEGYLEPDDETGNIYDPRDDHSLNCHVVRVVIENTNYEAELGDVNYKKKNGCEMTCPNGSCEPDDANITLTALIHDTQINYITTTNSNEMGVKLKKDPVDIYKDVRIVIVDGVRWTNRQLDLTANLNANLAFYDDIAGIKYIWNNDSANITTTNKHTTSVRSIYNAPYSVEAVSKADKHYKAQITYSFDNKAPEIKKGSMGYVNSDKDTWKKSKEIYFEVVEDGVGLDRVYIGKRPCSDMKKDLSMGKQVSVAESHKHVQTYTVKEETGDDGENGELNVCAIDKLGNITSDNVTVTFTVPKVDITPPHCTKGYTANRKVDVIGEHNVYQWYNRTIKQYCFDNNIINGKKVIGSGCNNNSDNGNAEKKTFEIASGNAMKVGYITIKDHVGWTTKCPVDVYVDKKGPLCSKTTGNTQTHVNNKGATTLGVGSTNNWDQNYRHITQYCYDEHVGCSSARGSNPSKSAEWSYSDGLVIRTGKIKIWDKVKACSQKAAFSDDSYCYSNYNASNNDTVKNNSTNCTVGVYIDHMAPEASNDGGGRVHGGNRIKFVCSDPSYNGVAGSGVLSFKATASSGSGTQIQPCHSASDCSTSYGPQITNTTGGRLQFKIITVTNSLASPRDDITVETYCEDKAHNIENRTTDNNNAFNVGHYIADSFGNPYMSEKNLGPASNGCLLREFRPAYSETCSEYNYDCEMQDTKCNSNNDGEGVSCCLQGHSPKYGCKKYDSHPFEFGKPLNYTNYAGVAGVRYFFYGGDEEENLYVIPPNDDDHRADRIACCGDEESLTCHCGYKCTVYNCYPDNPLGNTQKQMNVCGNNTK